MKKILSALLALFMLASCFSFSAVAVEDSSTEESAAPEISAEPVESEEISPVESEEISVEAPSREESQDVSVEAPVEESSDVVSEETSSETESEEPVETREIVFSIIGEGRISIRCGDRVFSKLNADKGCTIEVPVGEDAVFSIIPTEGVAVLDITVISADDYAAEPAAATVTINNVSRNAFVDIELTAAEFVPVSVTVLEGEDGQTHGSYNAPSDKCVAGGSFNLSLLPAAGYGVKSVTVNGTALAAIPFEAGTVSIAIEEETEIEVEYSLLYEIIVSCGEGGSFTVAGAELAEDEYVVKVPEGRAFSVSIVPDEGKVVKAITLSNGTTVRNRTEYSFTVSGNERVTISFDDAEAVYYVSTQVIDGVGGEIFPDTTQQVYEGNSIEISFVPEDGYVIDYVTVNGVKWDVTGEMVPITNIRENKHVRVKFKLADESSEEISEEESSEENAETPESTEKPGENTDGYDADGLMAITTTNANGEVWVSLAGGTVVKPSGIIYLNKLLDTQTVRLGVDGEYEWFIPVGEKIAEGKAIDFGVVFNGEYTEKVKQYFETKAGDRGFEHLPPILVVERNDNSQLPAAALLKVNAVKLTQDDASAFAVGNKAEWIKHTPLSNEYVSYINNQLLVVDENGYLAGPMNGQYGVFLGYISSTSTVKVVFNSAFCSLNTYSNKSKDENGNDVIELLQKSGEEFSITVRPKNGYCFKSISSNYSNMTLYDEKGNDITAVHAGFNAQVIIRVSGVSADGVITLEAVEEASEPAQRDTSNNFDWGIFAFIIVIVIVMIGGGIFFVIKWRQGEDDEDDDEYEDYEDEEDEE
ncbi:MAG: membrane lipoprotein lipid attachment site-containing protein [Clostridia bacterium]|nr:membrane lipoprotein lipid attachment site-containing protein [Clostridia bacterium]